MSAEIHIRKRAGRSLARPGYSHQHAAAMSGGYRDPMADTLCGAPSTDQDMSWAETRWPKNRAYVTCERCLAERLRDPKAVAA